MNFAGFGNPPHSPPARATHCALVGGYVREEGASSCGGDVGRLRASAPLRGSLRRLFSVPFRTSPPSRGALRSAGVPTIAANTTLAPQRSFARHLGRPMARGNTPSAPRFRALWVTGGSPHLFSIAFGGTYQLGTRQRRTFWSGLLLGRLGGDLGARQPPDLARRRRPGECGGGKQMWPAASPAQRRPSSAVTRALAPADPVI